MSDLCLRGITWNHSRALPPLVAAAQRFEELHPQVRIRWEKRSLDDFGHASLAALADSYDLLIIDHPMMGEAHRGHLLMDLQPLVSPEILAELEGDALGACLECYRYESCLYALPVDAAAPAASYRPDLLERRGHQVPVDWDQVIALARQGLVRMPGFPADLFLNFMGMCVSRGSSIALGESFFDHEIARRCLEELRELASFMPNTIYSMNPIALYEAMASGSEFAYCPFAYTYSNYSRPGFAPNILLFANAVRLSGETLLHTVLGGTGIAVSAKCGHANAAVDFCLFVSGRSCQTHLYGICQGQPASASAWRDPLLNRASSNFFERTLASIQAAFVRPRYPGYIAFQRSAGVPIAEYLRHEVTSGTVLQRLDNFYRESLLEFSGKSEIAS